MNWHVVKRCAILWHATITRICTQMDKENTPFGVYFDPYQLALSYEGNSPKTLATYLANLNQFACHLQAKVGRAPVLADFTPDVVMGYIADRLREPRNAGRPFRKSSAEPLSLSALDQYVRPLEGFATWRREKRHTRANVLKDLQRPRLLKTVIEPMSEPEVRSVFAGIDTKTVYRAQTYAILL